MKFSGDRLDTGATTSGCLGGDRRHQVYRALKARALLYRFRPGQHLAVIELSDQLKVSNTPVREALIRLHAEGHIAAVPARGFFARELRLREMQEVHDLLRVLLRHSVEGALANRVRVPYAASGPEPSTHCDPRTAIALARRTEAVFIGIAACAGSDFLHRTVADLCDRTHHIRRCAYRSYDLNVTLHAILCSLASGLGDDNREFVTAALDDHFRVIDTALPDLVMRALAISFTQDWRA